VRSADLLSRHFLVLATLAMLFIIAAILALGPLVLGQVRFGDQAQESLSGLGRFLGSLLVAAAIFWLLREVRRGVEPALQRRAWLLAVFALLSLLTVRFTYLSSFPNADYSTEFMVYAHGAPATKAEVLDQVERLSRRMYGDLSIKVAYDNDVSWPMTWYFREYPNRLYFSDNPGRNILDAPIIVAGSLNWDKVDPIVADDYDIRTYTFLWWPMEDYRQINWAALFGYDALERQQDPPPPRRGLLNPDVREALWNIFFYRDYTKYGEVFGGNFLPSQWPLRHDLRVYIRKDVLAQLWDHGALAASFEPPVDPYEGNEFTVAPSLVIDQSTSGESLLAPRNLALGPDGRIYVADSGNHQIKVFDANGQYILGWGEFGAGAGQLNEPWGLAVTEDAVFVADTWNHRIQKFSLTGELLDIYGQSGQPVEGDAGLGLFFGPRDIALLSDGRFLISDTGNHRLQIMSAEGEFTSQVGGIGGQLGQFNEPVGIDTGPDANIYLADTWNGRIQKLTGDLLPIWEWEVDAWAGESTNNKPYLAVDGAGRVYVTDPEGYRVLIFSSDGAYLGRFGHFGPEITSFGLPNGIAVDPDGNIYVADAGNNRVLRFPALFSPAEPAEEGPEDNAAPSDEVEEGPAAEEPTMEAEASPTATP
jgi:DNA-binding beta-propeller fold protein YncE